jgi:hypothetical protein
MRKLLEQHMSECKITTHEINLEYDIRTLKTKLVMEVNALTLDLPKNIHRLELHGDWGTSGAEVCLYSRHGFILNYNAGFHEDWEVLQCLQRVLKNKQTVHTQNLFVILANASAIE